MHRPGGTGIPQMEQIMTSRIDEVTMTWVGQDGRKWRTINCWVGNGYRSFTQCEVQPGLWLSY